jgi:ribonuclease HI
MRAICFAHGACHGDPGPAAVGGVVLAGHGGTLAQVSERIGITSPDVAAGHAARAVLERARDAGTADIELRTDSAFVVRQLTGPQALEDAGLVPLIDTVRNVLAGFDAWTVQQIAPDEDLDAVRLADAALGNPT